MEDYGESLFFSIFLLIGRQLTIPVQERLKDALLSHNSSGNSKKGQGITYSMKKLFSIYNEIWYPII